ncbi:MAG: DoxX family protein [Chloroflexota bacterium]|nr:DoxX family protein [Chloroflexota bacterium]
MNRALWTVQGLLAALFLFAGGVKLATPLDEMVDQSGLPGALILFIGVAEVLGALGLILPGLLRIAPGLTPLAAAGLVIIMSGATVLTAAGGNAAPALFPLVVGLVAALVACGRWRLAPLHGASRSSVLQPTM